MTLLTNLWIILAVLEIVKVTEDEIYELSRVVNSKAFVRLIRIRYNTGEITTIKHLSKYERTLWWMKVYLLVDLAYLIVTVISVWVNTYTLLASFILILSIVSSYIQKKLKNKHHKKLLYKIDSAICFIAILVYIFVIIY